MCKKKVKRMYHMFVCLCNNKHYIQRFLTKTAPDCAKMSRHIFIRLCYTWLDTCFVHKYPHIICTYVYCSKKNLFYEIQHNYWINKKQHCNKQVTLQPYMRVKMRGSWLLKEVDFVEKRKTIYVTTHDHYFISDRQKEIFKIK